MSSAAKVSVGLMDQMTCTDGACYHENGGRGKQEAHGHMRISLDCKINHEMTLSVHGLGSLIDLCEVGRTVSVKFNC